MFFIIRKESFGSLEVVDVPFGRRIGFLNLDEKNICKSKAIIYSVYLSARSVRRIGLLSFLT